MVEDACLWNKYIRNARVRIPLATLNLSADAGIGSQQRLKIAGLQAYGFESRSVDFYRLMVELVEHVRLRI